MKKYLPRYTDYELKESLEYMGAVLILVQSGVERLQQLNSNVIA